MLIDEARRPWRREVPGETPENGYTLMPDIESRDELVTGLMALPPMQRQCVLLRHWLGLTVEETAAELGIAPGTVKAHTHRGLARLRALLTTTGDHHAS